MDIAGRDCTQYLQKTLMDEAVYLFRSAEFEISRDLKERYCRVSQNYEKDIKNQTGYSQVKHTLPDGQIIDINSQQIRVPEILFNPGMVGTDEDGIHQMLADSLRKSDIDLRDELSKNIFLSGGGSMFPGIASRVQDEVQMLIPPEARALVRAERHRKYGAFIGAAMVAALPTFDDSKYITRRELHEYGPSIIHRKSF